MASMLTRMENGEYFTEAGEVRRDLPIDYVKAKTWELRPRLKVPQQEQHSAFIEDQGAGSTDASQGMRVRIAQQLIPDD